MSFSLCTPEFQSFSSPRPVQTSRKGLGISALQSFLAHGSVCGVCHAGVPGQPGLCEHLCGHQEVVLLGGGWVASPHCRRMTLSPPPSGAPHSASSTSLHSERSGGSGTNLGGFGIKPDGGSGGGMHQRSYSVSSADQWNEAVVIPSGAPNPGEWPLPVTGAVVVQRRPSSTLPLASSINHHSVSWGKPPPSGWGSCHSPCRVGMRTTD